eukprot:5484035-Heterocapsa_arctica.AAC.1
MYVPPTSRYTGDLCSVENTDGRIGTQTSDNVHRSSVSTLPIVRASGSTADSLKRNSPRPRVITPLVCPVL